MKKIIVIFTLLFVSLPAIVFAGFFDSSFVSAFKIVDSKAYFYLTPNRELIDKVDSNFSPFFNCKISNEAEEILNALRYKDLQEQFDANRRSELSQPEDSVKGEFIQKSLEKQETRVSILWKDRNLSDAEIKDTAIFYGERNTNHFMDLRIHHEKKLILDKNKHLIYVQTEKPKEEMWIGWYLAVCTIISALILRFITWILRKKEENGWSLFFSIVCFLVYATGAIVLLCLMNSGEYFIEEKIYLIILTVFLGIIIFIKMVTGVTVFIEEPLEIPWVSFGEIIVINIFVFLIEFDWVTFTIGFISVWICWMIIKSYKKTKIDKKLSTEIKKPVPVETKKPIPEVRNIPSLSPQSNQLPQSKPVGGNYGNKKRK